MYKKRLIEEKIRRMAGFFKMILLVGPRQVGKSTLLRHLFPDIPVFTFDQYRDVHEARSNPERFLDNNPAPLILDEIQYVPELISALKRRVDESDVMGQYFLTGSQNLSMLKTVAESMAGRVGIFELGGMTQYEKGETFHFANGRLLPPSWLEVYLTEPDQLLRRFAGTHDSQTLYQALWYGSLPYANQLPVEGVPPYYHSYLNTYLERDVRLVSSNADLHDFERFVRLVAASSAQEINHSQLGRDLGIPGRKAQAWLEILFQTYQWRYSQPYHGNILKRISKRPKGYFADTGMICRLLQISDMNVLAGHPFYGALFETWVFNMVYALNASLDAPAAWYHWRTNAGAEVDMVIERDGWLFPIEVKGGDLVTGHDARGLEAFRKSYPDKRIATGVIIYAGREAYRLNKNTIVMPWNMLVQ